MDPRIRSAIGAIGVLGAVTLAACVPAREARVIAARQDSVCGGRAAINSIADVASVQRVEPLYAHVSSGMNGYEARLAGAQLSIRQVQGMNADELTHALRCYEARQLLRADSTTPSVDPFWLPGDWVDIDAQAEGTGYVVRVRGEQFDTAKQILDRAVAFAHP